MNDANYLQKAGLLGVLHAAECSWGMERANEPENWSLCGEFAACHVDAEGCCDSPKVV